MQPIKAHKSNGKAGWREHAVDFSTWFYQMGNIFLKSCYYMYWFEAFYGHTQNKKQQLISGLELEALKEGTIDSKVYRLYPIDI